MNMLYEVTTNYVSQLSANLKRRLNQQPICLITGEEFNSFDRIVIQKRRNHRLIEYRFAKYEAYIDNGAPNLFLIKGDDIYA